MLVQADVHAPTSQHVTRILDFSGAQITQGMTSKSDTLRLAIKLIDLDLIPRYTDLTISLRRLSLVKTRTAPSDLVITLSSHLLVLPCLDRVDTLTGACLNCLSGKHIRSQQISCPNSPGDGRHPYPLRTRVIKSRQHVHAPLARLFVEDDCS
jgi:hypothetical protein